MLTPADMPPEYVLVIATMELLEIQDEYRPELRIEAGLTDLGRMSFEVETVDLDDGSRSVVRGKVLFDLMMSHWGVDAIQCVATYWGSRSTNLADFNRLSKAGLSHDQAAKGTWTGLRLKDYGYVNLLEKVDAIGGRGAYGIVSAVFVR